MIIKPIQTARIQAGTTSLNDLLDVYIKDVPEHNIIVVTSKLVSLCENRVVLTDDVAKETLVEQESDRYIPTIGKYGFSFTVTNNTLIPAAGIDESNGDGNYVLWPRDVQASANAIREHLVNTSRRKHIGVIITDSTCTPLRRGTSGIYLAHSGFKALNDYVGKSDLFGRPYKVSQSNVAGGLAAAAVVAMGEGAESTPLCLIQDVPFVQFDSRNPSAEEIAALSIPLEEDIFAPFLTAVQWRHGQRKPKHGH